MATLNCRQIRLRWVNEKDNLECLKRKVVGVVIKENSRFVFCARMVLVLVLVK